MGLAEDDEYRRRWMRVQPPPPGQVLAGLGFLGLITLLMRSC